MWWTLSLLLIVLGLAGTVLPALPGTLFVAGGILLGAWIDDFSRVGGFSLSVVAVLALLAWVLDYVAGLLGAKRAGARHGLGVHLAGIGSLLTFTGGLKAAICRTARG